MTTNKDMEFNGILTSYGELHKDLKEIAEFPSDSINSASDLFEAYEKARNQAQTLSNDYNALKDFLNQTIDQLNDETAESIELKKQLEEAGDRLDSFLENYRELLMDYMDLEEKLGENESKLNEIESERDEQSLELATMIYEMEQTCRRYDSQMGGLILRVKELGEMASLTDEQRKKTGQYDLLSKENKTIKSELEKSKDNFEAGLIMHGQAVRKEAKKQIRKYQWAAGVGITAAVILGIALAANSCEGNEYSMSPSLESTATYQTIKGNGN